MKSKRICQLREDTESNQVLTKLSRSLRTSLFRQDEGGRLKGGG